MGRHPPELTRRQLLQAGMTAGAAWLIGIDLAPAREPGAAGASYSPGAFIRIDRQGQITLVMPQVEMGQGVYTALAMILAEELDADLARIVLQAAPPDDQRYGNPILGFQVTGGSTSVRAFWMPLRKAAAAARATLVQAAAQLWKVAPASIRTSAGDALHEASGRRAGYGMLVPLARTLTLREVAPKSPADFRLLGRPQRRLDTPDKVHGRAVFGIDVQPTGLCYASIRSCPMFGGRLESIDDRLTRAMPGVREVLQFRDFAAVVAGDTWTALRATAALVIHWQPGGNSDVNTDDLWDKASAASGAEGAVAQERGDPLRELARGDVYDAVYQLPLLAHAAMEPLNCTVHVTSTGCELWVGVQVCARAQAAAARITGLPPERVIVHNQLLGGAFGRRLEVDYVEKSVQIAQRIAAPVKVMWSREEDMQHDVYRPLYLDSLSARLENRRISAWQHRITGSSVIARWAPPAFRQGIDGDAVDAAIDLPYSIPHFRVEYVRDEPFSVPTGFWRGVGPNNNVFAVESFVDELAHRVRQDPLEFRRAHLQHAPRFLAVLDRAAEKAGWGTPLPLRHGRGVSVSGAFGSYLATIVEVRVEDSGDVRVQRVVCALDAGFIVNPDTVISQLEGGVLFGLTAALWGRIDIRAGRVVQRNFNDYRVMRINEAPSIEVLLAASDAAPGGIGETGTAAAPPAFVNALFAATGVRLQELPIDRRRLAKA